MTYAARLPRLFIFLLFIAALPAHAGSPLLSNLHPVAAQRGKTIDVTFYGERLADTTQVIFHDSGITAGPVKAESKKVATQLTIAADAPLGEHKIRLLTKTGVTEMITLHIVDRPVVSEKRDERIKDGKRFRQSTSFDEPQAVELGTTILGRTEPEDVDYFSVDLKKGQRLTVQVDGMRLGRGFTDSHLSVLNSERYEVASSDDTALLKQDPYVSFLAPADGKYTILVRDSGYGGNNNNWYMMHVGSFPRPSAVYPLGGKPGEQVTLKFMGDPSGDFMHKLTLPGQADNDYVVVPERDGQLAPTGHAFRLNDLPNILEDVSKPNDAMSQVKEGPAFDAPVALNGIIEKPRDNDYFKIRLKKNQQVRVTCFASRMGSPLDPIVNVFNVKDGKHLQGNDDYQGSADSELVFKAPEDGEYYVRVRDHLNEGGAHFAYRVEVTVTKPAIRTYVHRYDNNRPQLRHAIAVPRGNRTAALVRISRSGVGGDLDPIALGLPEGVKVTGLGPGEKGDMMPVVFEVPADAPLGVGLVNLTAQSRPKGDSAERVVGQFSQIMPTVVGNPNRTEYYYTRLDSVPVAVTEAVPFKIEIEQPKAPIVKDGVMKLKVNVTRQEGFDKRVRLYMLYRPPGIGGAGQVDLVNGNTEAHYHIDANTSTPTRDWPMVIYGYGEVPGGPVWTSSQVFQLKVEDPFITGSIAKASCTQGEAVDIVVKLDHPREWSGEAQLKLLGLPAECKASPMTIKPGQKQATFRVTTAANTPPGQHKSLMCELVMQVNGQDVIHRFGRGGRLRVDKINQRKDAQANAGAGQ